MTEVEFVDQREIPLEVWQRFDAALMREYVIGLVVSLRFRADVCYDEIEIRRRELAFLGDCADV